MLKWFLASCLLVVSLKTLAGGDRKSLTLGPDSADYKITIYSGLTDPWYSFYDQMLKQALADKPEKVQVTFRHNKLSFHPGDEPAALSTECAGEQGRFWQMHDELTSELQSYVRSLRGTPQSEIDSVKPVVVDSRILENLANLAGLDMDKYRKCLLEPEIRRTVERDFEEAEKLGHGVGTLLIINGVPEDLPPFYPALKERLDQIERDSRKI